MSDMSAHPKPRSFAQIDAILAKMAIEIAELKARIAELEKRMTS